jgi:glycosyltransferase involved in cell wall biosynthesis
MRSKFLARESTVRLFRNSLWRYEAMRILYVTQYYPPEIGAGASRAREMVRNLVSLGHRLTVLTAFPNYLTGVVPPEYRKKLVAVERCGGAVVIRVWTFSYRHRSVIWRLLNYASFMVSAAVVGLLSEAKYDVVYASSPPPFVGLAGWAVAFWRSKKFAFEARDIWPKAAVMAGQLKNRYAALVGQALENFCYARAKLIIAVTKGLLWDLRERGYPESRIHLIENGVNTDLYRPRTVSAFREGIGYSETDFVVVYAGVLGHMHTPDVILRAAQSIGSGSRVRFLLIGEGLKKKELMEEVARKEMDNVTFVSGLPEDELCEYVSSCDVGVATVRKGKFFEIFIPVKMFTYMACGLPVVLAARGEAEDILRKSRGGVVVPPEDAGKLAEAISHLSTHADESREMGRSGRDFAVRHYSRKGQARKLEGYLLDLKES